MWINYHYQIKCSYLRNQRRFAVFFLFLEFTLNFEKNEPHSLGISEVIDSERRSSILNA